MLWTPAFHQYRLGKNKSRLNSLWLGTIWAFLTLPEILLFNLLVPAFANPKVAHLRLLSTVVLLIKLPLFGLLGQVSSEDVTIEELAKRLRSIQ
jgi:hypothetical protein